MLQLELNYMVMIIHDITCIRNISDHLPLVKRHYSVFLIGLYQFIELTHLLAGKPSVLKGTSLFKAIFRKSVKYIELLLYSKNN